MSTLVSFYCSKEITALLKTRSYYISCQTLDLPTSQAVKTELRKRKISATLETSTRGRHEIEEQVDL